ncbi:MAG: efflux transporter outer membrane subunit [Chitinophagaceae bacterium]|nr:efflux transporter outer membrane subunit [Chitinophagaceae bacterium]
MQAYTNKWRTRLMWVAVFVFAGFFLSACFVARPYQAPENLIDNSYYRAELSPDDTASMAAYSWKELFTDAKLQQHITHALENNTDILNAIQQINIAEAYLKQGKASFFPTVTATVTAGTAPNNSAIGNLSWEADVWGKIKSNKDAALANLLGSRAAYQAVMSQLVSSLADTYYRLMALDEEKRITEESIANREKNLETTRALKDAGKLTAVAIEQSNALLINSKGILVNLDNNIKLLENYFCLLLNVPSQHVDRNTLGEQKINVPLSVGVPVQLLANRPDVKVAEYNYMSAFFGVNAAKAAFYPSLTLNAGGGFQAGDFDKLFDPAVLFGAVAGSLMQPVINKRQIRTQYEVAKARKEIAYNNYKKTILTAAKDVSDALFVYEAQDQLTDLKQQEFERYDVTISYSQDLVNNGMGNFLDVITAMQNSLNARLNYVDAQYGRLSAIVQLYRALGGGWK